MSSNVLILRNTPISLTSNIGRAFVSDCARQLEDLINIEQLRERYGLSIEDWQQLKSNEAVTLALQTELKQRIRSGVSAQEAAAKEFTATPPVVMDPVPNLAQTLMKDSEFTLDLCRFSEGRASHKEKIPT